MKTISIAPKKTFFRCGCIYAMFDDRTYKFEPKVKLVQQSSIFDCGTIFVSGILMLSYTDQVEEIMAQNGFAGTITIINKEEYAQNFLDIY